MEQAKKIIDKQIDRMARRLEVDVDNSSPKDTAETIMALEELIRIRQSLKNAGDKQ